MKEEFLGCLPIEGSVGYFIHPTGRVFKLQEMSQHDNGYGYKYCKIDGGKRTISVHREVAKAFLPNLKGLPQVDHKDSDRSNNNETNLQWMSAVDNMRKAWEKGDRRLMDSKGNVYEVKNVRCFSEAHGLDSSSVSKVFNGKLKSTKGWVAV